jgi:predicted RNA polymerase sigma factor
MILRTSGENAKNGMTCSHLRRQLSSYHLLYSVWGDLLSKLGRLGEARSAFQRAAGLTRNRQEITLLQRRAIECVETRDLYGRDAH